MVIFVPALPACAYNHELLYMCNYIAITQLTQYSLGVVHTFSLVYAADLLIKIVALCYI